MPTEKSPNNHVCKFKNRGKSALKMRARRATVCLVLRKTHRFESILKKRNISSQPDDEPLSPGHRTNNQQVISATIQEILANVNSDCPERKVQGCRTARKLVSLEMNAPLKEIVEAGLLTYFVEFLGRTDNPTLQFEAAWSLSNVASGKSWYTQQVVEHGAVPGLIALLTSPKLSISEHAICAVGNIAGDGPTFRDALIDSNVIPALLELISPSVPVSYICTLTWTLANLCRNNNPFPRFSAVQQMLPSIVLLLNYSDVAVISDACWAISYLTDGPNERIDIVVKTGVIPRLVELLHHEEVVVLVPALRSIGNIVSGSDLQTQLVIDAGVLSALPRLMHHHSPNVQKEAAWIVSNIAAGPCEQIQQLTTCGLLPHIVALLKNAGFQTRQEAAWAALNYTSGGTVEQKLQFVKCGGLAGILNLLTLKDTEPKTIMVILEVVYNLFLGAEKLGEVEGLCLLMEELRGLHHLNHLLDHENSAVSEAAMLILDKYFQGGDYDED